MKMQPASGAFGLKARALSTACDAVVVPPCTLLTSPLTSLMMCTRLELIALKLAGSKRPACCASLAAVFAVASA